MNVHIWYFSGTGNTWYISCQIAQALARRGCRVSLSSIESSSPAHIDKMINRCDVIGFGYPVYGSDVPVPMKKFLGSLPVPKKEIPVFLFCTQWLFSGNATQAALEFFPSRLYRVSWSEHLFMPNNVSVTVLPLPYTNDPHRIARRAAGQEARISRLADHITAGHPSRRGFSKTSILLGAMQRAPFRRFFSSLQDDISIDTDRCVACGYCSSICPVENLIADGDGRVHPQGRCILCLRCYNFCPTQAVLYRGKAHRAARGVPYRGPGGFNPRDEKKRWHNY